MQTKALTLTIIFAVLTIILNPEISKIQLPAPYAPFLIYQIWEIPIVAALLLLSFKSSIAIAGLNAVVLFALFQGASPLGPFYNLIAILAMLLGIFLAHVLFVKRRPVADQPTSASTWQYSAKLAAVYTVFGAAFRTVVMGVFNYFTLQYPPPVGYALAQPVVVSYYVPASCIFNATLALYTIPLGYFIAVVIKRNLRHANML
jgi:riboflavin transporter FmnP